MDILEKYIKPEYRFRDPIYGFIEINELEREIIDTYLFQRLRRVHQLALGKYVYPTAEHSRFTHSLGVLQMATIIFSNLYRNSKEFFSEHYKSEKDIAKDLKTLRFAALLHDIGHTPFSHSTEKVMLGENIQHEDIGKFIIENYEPIKSAIEETDISPKAVSSLLTGQVPADKVILKNIVSGHLDADRADYLLRDSYFCGVKYGEYDFNRFFRAFSVDKDSNGNMRLCVNEEDIYLVEAFLLARYHYNLQVPYHRTRMGYDIVLEKYIEYLKRKGKLPNFIKIEGNEKIKSMDFDEFCNFDDYSIFEKIKKDSKKNKWANMLLRQDHLYPVFDHIKTEKNEMEFREAILRIRDIPSIKKDKNIFIKTEQIEVSKLPDETSKEKKYLGVKLSDRNEIYDILEFSNILKQLIKPMEICRIYLVQKDENVIQQIQDVISHFNELREVL